MYSKIYPPHVVWISHVVRTTSERHIMIPVYYPLIPHVVRTPIVVQMTS